MAKVSIIIPAYNSEKTLAACLGNVIHQTLQDIEIILINDCSTDNTFKIMLDFEAAYPDKTIVVNSDRNRGAGGARNIGLSYASGEYIGFVDSDDIPSADMFEKLYIKAKERDYDIVDCGYYNEAADNAMIHTSDDLTGLLDNHKRSELIVSGGYFWSKLFRHSFLDKAGLQFRENVILEDSETLMKLFACAKSIGNVKEILYLYKNLPDSASKNVNAFKYFENSVKAIRAIYDTMSLLPCYPGISEAVEYAIVQLYSYCINLCLSYGQQEQGFEPKEKLFSLYSLVKPMIKTSYNDNVYICNKISKEDMRILLETEHTLIY